MKKILLIIAAIVLTTICFAQNGGENIYSFLQLPFNSRVSALGGYNVSHIDGDLGFVDANPAMLRKSMDNQLSLNYVNYFSDINLAHAVYARNFEKAGIFSAGINYMNYGNLYNTDDYGEILGTFSAADYLINVSYAYEYKRFNFGATFKTIVSDYWEAKSFGLAFDLGATYVDTAKLLSAGLVLKNIGFQLKRYTKGVRESLPFDVQVGITKKFAHAPLAISLTACDLTHWSLAYESVLATNYIVEPTQKNFWNKLGNVGDEIMRHFIIGADVIIGKYFYLSLGYNYRRRAELAVKTKTRMVGFSAGFGLNLKKFSVEYSYSSYHLAGAMNYVSLKLNFNNIIVKK